MHAVAVGRLAGPGWADDELQFIRTSRRWGEASGVLTCANGIVVFLIIYNSMYCTPQW